MLQQRNMKTELINSWEQIVPGIKRALSLIEQKTLIGFGMVPYPRIVPALFLKNYEVYAVKDTADLDVLRPHAKIFCLEEKFPKAAAKIHAASYLLGNYAFHAFLKSRHYPFRLLLHRTTIPIVKKLEDLQIDWIGNKPETFQDVLLKADFHALLKKMNLPCITSTRILKEEFSKKTFPQASNQLQPPFTVQRVYSETGLEQNPFFIRNENDWEDMRLALSLDQNFTEVQISPLSKGLSLAMVGCITHQGVLTSSLQLQFVDVPEILHGKPPLGILLGYDLRFCQWDTTIETTAQKITEQVGEFLFNKGFLGVFGINFFYNQKTNEIFAQECIPQFPEDMHIYSLAVMNKAQVPPMDFFHLMAHLGGKETFDFQRVNSALKERLPVSHIFLLQEGVQEMKLPLRTGVYSFDSEKQALTFQREGAFAWELRNSSEFLMIDSMPRLGKPVIDNVPSLFKLIFSESIGKSSSQVQPTRAALLSALSKALYSI
jgi:hypothetical protein